MAAHLHDSVLQTLAMVQRRADDPAEVASSHGARSASCGPGSPGAHARGAAGGLAPALEAAATEVEQSHGTPVEVVVVGDVELDAEIEAVVAAAREAMTNAAKFGAGSPIDVYSEVSNGRVQVFVRDRGPGFDTAVPTAAASASRSSAAWSATAAAHASRARPRAARRSSWCSSGRRQREQPSRADRG